LSSAELLRARWLQPQLFQLPMPHYHLHPAPAAQMFRQPLRQIHGAMLPTGAAERYHQVLEAAALIIADARIHQRDHAGEELMRALLLVEILDHRRVFSGQAFETLFASRIGNAAGIEDEAAAVPGLIRRHPLVK